MPVARTAAQGLDRRLEFDHCGSLFARREYFRPEAPGMGPDAYLVEQSETSVIRPHFHRVDQFQVVVSGSGTLGRTEIKPVIVHYADAFTAYGPIAASDKGIDYFTLRPGYDAGAQYLPEEREHQRRVKGGRRHRLSRQVDLQTDTFLASLSSCQEIPLFDAEADGLAAYETLIPTGGDISVKPSGYGVYLLVLAGEIQIDHNAFAPWSVIYYTPNEAIPTMGAGSQGAQLLHLRFPRPRQISAT